MKALDRIRAGGDRVERGLHLRHVFELEGDMKVSELRGPQTELAPCDAVGVKLAILPQVLKIGAHACHEFHVMHPRLEIAPNVINVRSLPPLNVPRASCYSRFDTP